MPKPETNSRIFALIMIATQIIVATMHGVYLVPKNTINTSLTTLQPFIMAIITVLGFGLIFSYNKRLLWSGLGYTFFITAFVLQLYPLINDFWTKTTIIGDYVHGIETPRFGVDQMKQIKFSLSRGSSVSFYENHIESAFRCAIAISIAFSCILGRVGHLQCWFVTFIGTVLYELNRQICYLLYQVNNDLSGDPFGTMYIFAFGGFMGLVMGLFLSLRENKPKTSTERHHNYTSNSFSAGYALLGTAILVVGLPFLIFTRHADVIGSGSIINPFSKIVPVISVALSVAGSTLGALSLGLLIKGELIIRHLVYGPIAGAILGGASSYYTADPAYSLTVGTAGGLLMSIFMIIKSKLVNRGPVITTVSFTLFGLMGFFGSAFAVGWKEIIEQNSKGLAYTPFKQLSSDMIVYGVISSAMGIGAGIITGIIIYFINGHDREHQFTDQTNWVHYDGISTAVQDDGTDYYEEGEEIKNEHAYL